MRRVLVSLAALVMAASAALAQNSATAAKTCTVAGRVVKAGTGEPLKSAQVALLDNENRDHQHSYHVATDGEGAFVLNGVLPGHYRFSAMRNGYVPQEFKAQAGGAPGAILTLQAGQQLTDVLFRLVRTAAVVGRVTDEDGEPVAGVEVQALVKASKEDDQGEEGTPIPRGELVPASIAATNDLGEFRLYGLSPGEYYFSAVDSGDPRLSDYNVREGSYATELGSEPKTNHPPMYYPGVFQRSQAQSLTVRAGDDLQVDFSLRPAKTITVSGHVLGPDGKAADGATVMLATRDMDTMFTSMRNGAKIDAHGRFRVEGITPGSYDVTASLWVDQKQYSAQQKVEAGGEDIANVELALGNGVTITGRVLSTQGAFTQHEVHVWLSPLEDTGMSFGHADVNKDGTFRMNDLADDAYRVHVTGLADGWYLKSARFGTEDVLEHGLKVVSSLTSASLELVLSPNAAQLQGSVVQAESPVAGADVQIRPEANNPYRRDLWRRAKTDQYGQFALSGIPPGRYLISASVDDEEGETSDSEPVKLIVTESEKKRVKLEIPPPTQ